MSEAFQMRCAAGMLWDDEVSSHLSSQGYEIARHNVENTAPHFAKYPNYATSDNPSIRFVRYFPDGVAADFKNNVAFFWDAKNGNSIEKNAYETYLEFGANGREFFLFIKYDHNIYCVPLGEVKFFNSFQYVSRFPEYTRMPVDDGGWIAPRLWPEKKYLQWKYKNPEASGTPYRYFDFGDMKHWSISWPFDYQRIQTTMENARWKIDSTTSQQQLIQGVTA